MDPSRGTVPSKGSLRKDCMGLAVKKVLCRVVFGGNGARGSGARSKKPRRERRQVFLSIGPSWEKGSERAKPGELVNRFDSRYTLTENELYRKLVRWSGTCSRRWLNYYTTWRRTQRLWCYSSIPKVVFSVIRTLTVETEAAQSQRSSKNPRLLAASPVTAEPSRFGGFCTLVGDEAI